jgi:hypothetical protein
MIALFLDYIVRKRFFDVVNEETVEKKDSSLLTCYEYFGYFIWARSKHLVDERELFDSL